MLVFTWLFCKGSDVSFMQLLRLTNAYKVKPVRRRIGLPEPDPLKGPKSEAINERLKGHACIVPETDSVIFYDSFKPHCFLRFVRNNALASELKILFFQIIGPC